jgi:hypothetical protein
MMDEQETLCQISKERVRGLGKGATQEIPAKA